MERIVLAYSGGLDTSIAIPWLKETCDAEVIAVTPLNERTVLLLQNPNGWEFLASLPSSAASIPEAGTKVRASFAAAGTHIFDRQTGERLHG